MIQQAIPFHKSGDTQEREPHEVAACPICSIPSHNHIIRPTIYRGKRGWIMFMGCIHATAVESNRDEATVLKLWNDWAASEFENVARSKNYLAEDLSKFKTRLGIR